MRVILLPLLFIWVVSGQDEDNFIKEHFNVKLTGERGGPPQNAQFVPIGVVDLPVFNQKPSGKKPLPLKGGRPPPPPPINIDAKPTKPTKRPKPSGPIAPPPPPKPLPVDQGIPQGGETSESSGQTVPPLPPNVIMVTPVVEIRPDKETEVTSPPTRPTTTPNTLDALPALSQRFDLHDDGSYDFDFRAANSISRSEQGFFKRDALLENPIHVKTGTWSYISPEGIQFRVDFVADERGFRTFTHPQK